MSRFSIFNGRRTRGHIAPVPSRISLHCGLTAVGYGMGMGMYGMGGMGGMGGYGYPYGMTGMNPYAYTGTVSSRPFVPVP